MKYNLEKYTRNLGGLGKNMQDKANEMHNSVSMINSETDLKIFIDEHKSHQQFSTKIEYKAYEYS